MPTQPDYSKLTLPELLEEEKKLKRNEMLAAAAIGFLLGVMGYGLVRNGFGLLYTAIPLLLILGIYRHSQGQKLVLQQIRAEIGRRRQE
ncbi:hypothetical protein [Hymenobacter yonginensis]|uniref:FUSC family protein n=1 Tax=Hymenobacter yonginensis TaxID=748197 RepID=A0ABY7PNY1_9BACT|nr:hypothetical protein [Hymenobacter yonginensis]WBO84928.1 hypothetical protein O9Z63_01485 [Hymenobacter yonginensis]